MISVITVVVEHVEHDINWNAQYGTWEEDGTYVPESEPVVLPDSLEHLVGEAA
jgi:hypothetical protein